MPRRSGLGRGLDSLLPSASEGNELEERSGLDHVPVSSIDPNPRQPRNRFDDEQIAELATSIRELGILQPLLVRPGPAGRYELIAGERRLRAATAAGLDQVPVVVVETDDQGSLERALVENVHREDLNPIEEAAAYRQLIEDGGVTQESVGDRLGKSRVTITNALRLLDLPVEIQRYLIDGRLSAGHGRALLGLQGNPLQARLAQRVVSEGHSVRETEAMVRKYQSMSGMPQPAARKDIEASAAVAEAQKRLAAHLQTRVRVDMGKKKGKIVLDFVSLEELDRLTRAITDARSG